MTVVALYKNNSFIDDLRDQGYRDADFGIAKSTLKFNATLNSGNVVDREVAQEAYYRTDTGGFLGNHGLSYKLVSHTDMIDSARNLLERSDLNLEDIKEDITVGYGGAVCFVKHELPNHTIETPDGDAGHLTLLKVNSINSLMAYHSTIGLRQWACMNGQIFTNGAAGYYKNKHTQSLSLNHSNQIMANVLGIMDKQNEIWHQWYNTPVTSEEAFKIFAKAAGAESAISKIESGESILEVLEDSNTKKNQKLFYMLKKWGEHYASKLGKNYWGVYNVLTDWSTHYKPSPTKNKIIDLPKVGHQNSEIVRKIISSNSFAKAA